MAKLYFKYAPMNSGKSALLLMEAHSFTDNNISILCLKPSIDTRDGKGVITSRVGITRGCIMIEKDDDLYNLIIKYINNCGAYNLEKPKWILVDESQFLFSEQVEQLAHIVDDYDINVICYGLRTDFTSKMFEGSKRLFELADNIEEVKLTCKCGRKAVINARINFFGNIITDGEQVVIGGNNLYQPMCRKCYYQKLKDDENNGIM